MLVSRSYYMARLEDKVREVMAELKESDAALRKSETALKQNEALLKDREAALKRSDAQVRVLSKKLYEIEEIGHMLRERFALE